MWSRSGPRRLAEQRGWDGAHGHENSACSRVPDHLLDMELPFLFQGATPKLVSLMFQVRSLAMPSAIFSCGFDTKQRCSANKSCGGSDDSESDAMFRGRKCRRCSMKSPKPPLESFKCCQNGSLARNLLFQCHGAFVGSSFPTPWRSTHIVGFEIFFSHRSF